MKRFIVSASLIVIMIMNNVLFAQRSPEYYRDYKDFSVGMGLYTNTGSEFLKNGTLLNVNYGIFSYRGIGFRGGFNYIYGIDEDLNIFSVPLSFALRTMGRDNRTPVERVVSSAGTLAYTRGDGFSAFLALFSLKAELNAGLTPGYIAGEPYYGEVWDSYNGSYMEGLSVKNRFMLTADAGFRVSLKIWRFNFMANPQIHYNVTNNFRYRTSLENYDSDKVNDVFFSINCGVGFIL